MAEAKNEKIEREYVIPLREKYRHVARYKKTPKAIKSIKEFIARHMKVYDKDLNKIKVDMHVNEYLWARGIKNPPHSVKVKAMKDSEGIVKVELVDYPEKLKFKKARLDKQSKDALEAIEKKKTLKERMQETVKGTTSGKKEKSEDENKDGVKDSVEVSEKKASVKDAGEKMEKEMAKEAKHTTKSVSPKEEKNNKKEYNKSSRGK